MIGCRAQQRQVEDCTALKEVCFAMPQAEQWLLLEARACSYILKAVAFWDLRRINYHVGADEVVAF